MGVVYAVEVPPNGDTVPSPPKGPVDEGERVLVINVENVGVDNEVELRRSDRDELAVIVGSMRVLVPLDERTAVGVKTKIVEEGKGLTVCGSGVEEKDRTDDVVGKEGEAVAAK